MSAHEARDYGVVDMIVGQTAATEAADRAEAAVQEATAEKHSLLLDQRQEQLTFREPTLE